MGGGGFVVGVLGLCLFVKGLGEVVDGYLRIKGYFLGHVEIAYLKGWVSPCPIEGPRINSLCTHDAS